VSTLDVLSGAALAALVFARAADRAVAVRSLIVVGGLTVSCGSCGRRSVINGPSIVSVRVVVFVARNKRLTVFCLLQLLEGQASWRGCNASKGRWPSVAGTVGTGIGCFLDPLREMD
jgi:hypothetical protein